MYFTIEAFVLGTGNFRLQTDGAFRESTSNVTGKSDFTAQILSAAYERIRALGNQVTVAGQTMPCNPSEMKLGDPVAHVAPTVHRQHVPSRPSRDQLILAIKRGDDRENNSLLIDLDGNFVVRSHSTLNRVEEDFAVRHESFIAGNDFVGEDASRAVKHIDELYRLMLAGWLHHLKSGEVGHYVDTPSGRSLDDLLAEIDAFVPSSEET